MNENQNYHPIAEHAKTHYMPAITRELMARGYSKVHPKKDAESEPFNHLLARMMQRTGKHAGGAKDAKEHRLRAKSRAILHAIPDNRLVEVLGDALGAAVRANREKRRAAWAEIEAGRAEHREAQAKRNAARVH
jgi:hypothetical protein